MDLKQRSSLKKSGVSYLKQAVKDESKLAKLYLEGEVYGIAKTLNSFTSADESIYGSKDEKLHQDMIAHITENKFLARYIGFKKIYSENLKKYLDAHQDYIMYETVEKPNYEAIKMVTSNERDKMFVISTLDKDARITSVKILGPGESLKRLFFNYWPSDPKCASEAQLKKGVHPKKHFYGDLIFLQWEGLLPYITIIKDPNVNVPVKHGEYLD